MLATWITLILKGLLGLFIVLFILFGGLACSKQVNELDMDKATRFVAVLGAAGFTGDLSLELNGEIEFALKQSASARSPGTHLATRGHMNPAAVTPEVMAAYLRILEMSNWGDDDEPNNEGLPD